MRNRLVFDSDRMQAIREKYKSTPEYLWPQILMTDKYDELNEEKELLENLLDEIDTDNQRNLANRLINADDSSFLGAWFEIMLYGWLSDSPNLAIQPIIEGENPDFVFDWQGKKIVIEAAIKRIVNEELEEDKIKNAVWWAIHQVKVTPYIKIDFLNVVEIPDVEKIRNGVSDWIHSASQNEFRYEEKNGNKFKFTAEFQSLPATSMSDVRSITGDSIKPTLISKSNQHPKIQERRYPYLIAIYLESHPLNAEHVIEAWLGKEHWIYEKEFTKFIRAEYDRNGILFKDGMVFHESVSGFLVFKRSGLNKPKRSLLKGWFIENPFCNPEIHVDGSPFPVEDSYIVAKRYEDRVTMNWKKEINKME